MHATAHARVRVSASCGVRTLSRHHLNGPPRAYVRYVVDSGRAKRRVVNPRSGSSTFEVGWISKASADQRAGRAGRTGPGHCYRLYTSAVFADAFPAFEEPEVLRTPLDALVLTLKAQGIACASAFPLPSPPPPAALHAAIRGLTNIGAIVPTLKKGAAAVTAADHADGVEGDATTATAAGAGAAALQLQRAASTALESIASEALTPLGAAIARLPLAPPLAKLIVLAGGGHARPTPAPLLDLAIALAACVAASEPFAMPTGRTVAKRNGAGGAAAAGGDDDADDDGQDVEDEEADTAAERQLLDAVRADDAAAGDAAAADLDGVSSRDAEARDTATRIAAAEAAATAAALAATRNAAAAAHARFRHPLSDALSVLRAAGAYAHVLAGPGGAAAAAAFCRAHWLRPKAMREIVQLRRQLHGAVFGRGGGRRVAAPASTSTSAEEAHADGISAVASGDAGE